jgi:methylmalonyl-CoA/ethylmalonyl-CoA epimerase
MSSSPVYDMEPTSPTAGRPARLHHVGFVVRSIAASAQSFVDALGADWDGITYEDPLQNVRVTFLRPSIAASPEFELVEPLDENSPVHRFLNAGGKINHICYEVPDLKETLEALNPKENLVVRPPLPAVAFGGRPIAWVSTRHAF